MKKIVLVMASATFYIFIMGKFVSLYLADVYNQYSKNALSNGEFIAAENYVKKAVRKNPQEPTYQRQYAKVLLAQSGLYNEKEREGLKERALFRLEESKLLNEKNLATLRNIIPLYYFLALADLTAEENPKNIDQEYLPIIKNYYRSLKDNYSNDLGILADLAQYEKKLYLNDDYQRSLRMAEGLRPDVLDWYEAFN